MATGKERTDRDDADDHRHHDDRGDLVRAENFILATRDSGYRSPAYALAELVDNAIQAGATRIETHIAATRGAQWPLEIAVVDNGCGMDAAELRQALAFGGTSRFNDRTSLGRYGMGLPNGGLSLARNLAVCSWRREGAFAAGLDVDRIVGGRQRSVPEPTPSARPALGTQFSSGTAVRLTNCDRVPYRRAGNLASRLRADFGRIYRRYLAKDLTIVVNDGTVLPSDPLFLEGSAITAKATLFGDQLEYQMTGSTGRTGHVTVRFTELPLERWSTLSSNEKRSLGISAGPCFSVTRAGREIDRGWFFMGTKRRENYDDWWRCEVAFEPELDELFGITHAKQQISPTPELKAQLTPDIEAIGRALNSRIRKRFNNVKHRGALTVAEKKASRADRALPPIPRQRGGRRSKEMQAAAELAGDGSSSTGPYRIVVGSIETTSAYEVLVSQGQLTMVLNDRHPFFRDLYEPLASAAGTQEPSSAAFLALTVLAAARAEVSAGDSEDRLRVSEFRKCWSDVLAAFFNA